MKKRLFAVVTASLMLAAAMPGVSVNAFAVDSAEASVSAPPDTEAIELDWLPETEAEYQDFVNEYGHLSVHDRYIIYCDEINYSTGAEVVVKQSGDGEVKKVKEYDITDELAPPGTPSKVVMVFVAVTPGDIQLTISQSKYWDPNAELTEKESGTYVVKDDCTIEEKTNSDEFMMGDVNNDGAFNVSDVVLLQKWLLAVPDTHLANWKAVDFCEDNKLNVFDLCLMKRALIEKMNDEPQNVDISFKFNSVTDIRYNDDNHTKWTGFIARSENDLINILAENEGVSADKASIEGIDSNTFKDKSIVIVYSICTAGNSYSIIDNISVKGTSIDVSTISKKPIVATPDMLFRRYVYVIDKNAVTNADSFSFTDESSYYQYDEENDVLTWFKEWCQAQ